MSSFEEIVLVVEDEPQILALLVDYLQSQGYRVLAATCASEAFDLLATKPHLDLLLTDYRLPDEVSGVRIAEAALKLRPDLKVIFISGYPKEILDTGSELAKSCPVLPKPFSFDTLHQQIEQILS
jgi:CheY-like chemotaxis protein